MTEAKLLLPRQQVAYWVRRMATCSSGDSLSRALDVDPSLISRWAGAHHREQPSVSQAVEMASFSGELGLVIEINRKLGLERELIRAMDRLRMIGAVWGGKYDADAGDMIAAAEAAA